MHLLAATPGAITDGTDAIDLGQTPGDVVVLSAADSDLACLAQAQARRLAEDPAAPVLRLASLLALGHNMSVDLYVDQIISQARLVVVRVIGGRGYWAYGVEQVSQECRRRGIPVAFVPGDDQPDADLAAAGSVPAAAAHRLWQYLVQGGVENAHRFLCYAASLTGRAVEWTEPAPLPPAGVFPVEIRDRWTDGAPVVPLVFYRALVHAGNTAPVLALAEALLERGLNPLPAFVTSLKDSLAAGVLESLLADHPSSVILNGTAFAVAAPGEARDTPFSTADCPVLQVIFSGGSEAVWRKGSNGLIARDIAMNVALPEVDGRILSRAVSFKAASRRDEATQCDLLTYAPVPDRIAFVADLTANWARLRHAAPADRRVAFVLANYPNRDGRIGNGVGLDTPAAVAGILAALQGAGYRLRNVPLTGADLLDRLLAGPTNGQRHTGAGVELALPEYMLAFSALPDAARQAMLDRWGPPERDPWFRPGALSCGHFALPLLDLGGVMVGIQPSRGADVDPVASYHDPALPPPHGYLAFYVFLREQFRAQAVVHVGKHGTLEWLPGKAVALSADCFPEAVLGPLPHLYPFIVNDPGEGTQAKRRSSAVIIDHLTPPLTRAESYGPLKDLEALVDEYYEAAGVDPRRLAILREEILSLSRVLGLDRDLGFEGVEDETEALARLDNHLCDLKELQIRDGLHIFGQSPQGDALTDLLVALARVPGQSPVGEAHRPGQQSLLRALAADLDLAFDPLAAVMADPWTGPRPTVLQAVSDDLWRSTGDTVERLELLARQVVSGGQAAPGPQSAASVAWIIQTLRPVVAGCGPAEMAGLLRGLEGRFVPPGPSGAPTRGRPDVLPTGRNFFSVDTRTVPTPAAWALGWKSATLLLERHAQDHGEWPQALAVTAWGTANMRSGGDDLAQALAFLGVKPTWEAASRRVTGFEILPVSVLDRPRVDVTLRVSGFFRDAFPALIDLFDSAVRAVAALEEPADENPLAARYRADVHRLQAEGMPEEQAVRQAGFRVFGAAPGAYGAGLQTLVDEGLWEDSADLGRAYVQWGGYAYGNGSRGEAAHGLFRDRLRQVQAVVQNQDNREHDLLDSDEYYQFEGGLAAAVEQLSGQMPEIYHPDHSRPETPRIGTLREEIARIVRGRAANPKWIAGAMRHGYKGAAEMAATVDYLFGFAATARCVGNHHFDAIFDAYLGDEAVRAFLAEANPHALREMAARFDEAIDRSLWTPRRNSTLSVLDSLRTAA
ncbi:cobaltochelatase subunit CobN [Novispirillum itersonii]|uniref:cobaltochelatase subunit CobN n=1 Tax=Novispirillum itersonii TaxID=189 RepID=UPI00035F4676|nr:cobaltochelatase subunit CobN [Novispirillum itersonii]